MLFGITSCVRMPQSCANNRTTSAFMIAMFSTTYACTYMYDVCTCTRHGLQCGAMQASHTNLVQRLRVNKRPQRDDVIISFADWSNSKSNGHQVDNQPKKHCRQVVLISNMRYMHAHRGQVINQSSELPILLPFETLHDACLYMSALSVEMMWMSTCSKSASPEPLYIYDLPKHISLQ